MLKGVLDQDWAETYVQRAEVGGRTVYRVRVGKAVTRGEAQRLAQRLAAAGYDVIVVAE
jgi:diacylglycerol kinase family enzyme